MGVKGNAIQYQNSRLKQTYHHHPSLHLPTRAFMMHAVTRRSRLCAAGNTVERVLSHPAPSSIVRSTSSLSCGCSPLSTTQNMQDRPCRHLMTASLLENATIRYSNCTADNLSYAVRSYPVTHYGVLYRAPPADSYRQLCRGRYHGI